MSSKIHHGSWSLRTVLTVVLSVLGVVAVYGATVYFKSSPDNWSTNNQIQTLTSNVSVEWDKQFIDLTAKGGYEPRNTIAKANMSTTLKVLTNDSYGCETAMVIPSLGRKGRLDPSATTTVDIPPQEPWTTLQGMCSMGMYRFAINFVK